MIAAAPYLVLLAQLHSRGLCTYSQNPTLQLDMEHQSLWNLYQMRGLIERRHGQWIATDSKSPRHIPWASQYGGPDHIVFGHDSRKGLQVGHRPQGFMAPILIKGTWPAESCLEVPSCLRGQR